MLAQHLSAGHKPTFVGDVVPAGGCESASLGARVVDAGVEAEYATVLLWYVSPVLELQDVKLSGCQLPQARQECLDLR